MKPHITENVDALDLCFVGGLVMLSIGAWLVFDFGTALMVFGGVVTMIGLVALIRKVA